MGKINVHDEIDTKNRKKGEHIEIKVIYT